MSGKRFVEIFKNHFIFNKKNQGASKALTGNVIAVVFYVNDATSKWTESAIAEYKVKIKKAYDKICLVARNNNVDLNIRTASCQINVPIECTHNNTREWIRLALSGYSRDKASDYQSYFENKYNCDEAPVVFVFNKPFRAYAQSANENYPTRDEFSVLASSESEKTIIHELLHQFGAYDYYYPQIVYDAAKKYLPGSVMADGGDIDSLTQYLIGWKNTLGDNDALFLLLTQHLTPGDISQALKDEWKK